MSHGNVFNPECITYSQMTLIFNSRIYYRRLITWIGAYILARYAGIGTADDLFARIYLEALDIGKMLELIFGRVYAEQYGQLVSQFVIIFRDLITARIEGNADAARQNTDLLYQNVADRAEFLEAMNPFWDKEEYIRVFGNFIQFIIDIADSVATGLETGDYSGDIATYERLDDTIRQMGDVFAQGIYDFITNGAQYPEELPTLGGAQCLTYDEMDRIFRIRMFWLELATWTRNYMIARYRNLGNADDVIARLRQVPADYINALQEVFGDLAAEDYALLYNTYIDLLENFINAQMENNIDEVGRITQLLYRNADERAALIASVNPYWDETRWRDLLYRNLRDTIDQSTTFLMGNYARNIDIFGTILSDSEDMSAYFQEGLLDYLNFIRFNTEAGREKASA